MSRQWNVASQWRCTSLLTVRIIIIADVNASPVPFNFCYYHYQCHCITSSTSVFVVAQRCTLICRLFVRTKDHTLYNFIIMYCYKGAFCFCILRILRILYCVTYNDKHFFSPLVLDRRVSHTTLRVLLQDTEEILVFSINCNDQLYIFFVFVSLRVILRSSVIFTVVTNGFTILSRTFMFGFVITNVHRIIVLRTAAPVKADISNPASPYSKNSYCVQYLFSWTRKLPDADQPKKNNSAIDWSFDC